jgi:two-component system CheB/CheR fusion protein
MPPDPGMALVLVQHLDPHHDSILSDLLSRATPMKVEQITDGVIPQVNRVYVIPANAALVYSDGALHLHPRPAGATQMPIDVFFRSLSAAEGSKAIAVILSGTASDGTLGLKAIKAEGGITFCQDLGSAKYDGMPRSAIAAGCVDFVLPPKEIAHELVRLGQHPYVSQAPTQPEGLAPEPDFTEIFAMLRTATGVDFTFYKHATIRRRILRRMAVNRLETAEQYVAFIRQNRGELQSLFHDILINVTEFFREPATFDFLKARVYPAICAGRKNDDPIRIWVPGCATGEEAYSVGISLLEYLRDKAIEATIQIFGTDLSESALEKARSGIYPESISSEVSTERLRKFFTKTNGSYQITRSVRDLCIFARQNLTKDPPFSNLDLITCRNVLIYLGPVLQQKLMRVFHYALKPAGFLALGVSETVGSGTDLFQAIDRRQKIYSRKNSPASVALDFAGHEDLLTAHFPRRVQELPTSDFHRKVDELLLSRYAPAGVVVDSDLRILEFRGRTSPFLEHSSGEANLSLAKMTRGGLGMEIRKLVQKAKQKNASVRSDTLQFGYNEAVRSVRVSVIPVDSAATEEAHFLVLFEEMKSAPEEKGRLPKQRVSPGIAERRLQELEQELGATKLYLQSVIEEQEATTEELKSANEEIQSSNEELQSTNEELLTAKEELQSTNEELVTVNEEMHGRNSELTQINNDLSNLLSSVNIPIVMLGNDLRIRRFTPQAEKVLNLLPTDVGRPISDFKPKIEVPDLEQMLLDVIDTLKVREREVHDKDGNSYSMWIRPYRTADNKIDGAVMTLFDVTEQKSLVEARFRRLFETARDGILIVEAKSGEILDVNPFMFNLLGYQKSDLLGRRLAECAVLGAPDLEDMMSQIGESETWQRIMSLISKSGDPVDAEIVANSYLEGEGQGARRVVQLNIRDVNSRQHADITPRDTQKFRLVSRLASPLAKNLNNMLTAVVGYSDRVERRLGAQHPLTPEVESIRQAGERAAALTRQLLAFGHHPTSGIATLNLNEVVADLEQVVRVMLPEGIELELKPGPNPAFFRADRFQTEQILLDLVAHARDAMPDGGTLSIQSRKESVDEEFTRVHPAVPPGEYSVLYLIDTGWGRVDARPSPRPPVSRRPSSRSLDALQAAVRGANGYLWSYSEIGKGTQVAVYFPVAVARESAESNEDARGSETILIVDNEPAVRELSKRVLEDLGYKALVANDGVDSLKLWRENHGKVKLMITELSDRATATQLGVKAIFTTGDNESTVAEALSADERSRILRKPFTPAGLAHKVRSVLDA